MKTQALIVCSCAVLALGVTNASAGPCTTEIESLTKTLASKDAGAGPSPGASASSTQQTTTGHAGQHPPTATMSQATQGQAASPEDVRRQMAGQAPAAEQRSAASGGSQHPPTAVMTEATQGQAAPPATPGQHPPTAAMSEATQGQTAPGQVAASADTIQASAALDRAREFDKQGREAECMDAVRQAKQLSGV
jgi:hypothetical protein